MRLALFQPAIPQNVGACIRLSACFGVELHVIELVDGLAEGAFGGRRSEALSYHSWAAWSDWFDGESEDSSYFWLDRRTGLATVLLITDGP